MPRRNQRSGRKQHARGKARAASAHKKATSGDLKQRLERLDTFQAWERLYPGGAAA